MKYVTIYHMSDTRSDLHFDLRYDDREQPTIPEFEECYKAAETILGTDEPEEAFHRAQGHVVNEQQNARHMVHSSMPTDVYEVHTDDPEDPVAYFMVKPIGFERIDWEVELPRGVENGE